MSFKENGLRQWANSPNRKKWPEEKGLQPVCNPIHFFWWAVSEFNPQPPVCVSAGVPKERINNFLRPELGLTARLSALLDLTLHKSYLEDQLRQGPQGS